MDKIERILKSLVKNTVDMELEIRFSTFIPDDLFSENTLATETQPANFHFTPVINKKDFYRTFSIFESLLLKKSNVSCIDYFYPNNIRKTQYPDGNITWETKSKHRYYDVFPLNVRICVSKEKICDPSPNAYYLVRKKDRTCFYEKGIRYDFTRVTTTNMKSNIEKKSFEIEIERINTSSDCNHVLSCINYMLLVLQESFQLVTVYEQWNTILEYKLLTRSRKMYFIGAQPETFHVQDLKKIVKEKYSVTEKYDGERLMIFIRDSGNLFFLDRKLKCKSFGFFNVMDKGTLLDSEYVSNINTIFVFDILFYKGQDIRGNVQYPLPKRMELVALVLSNVQGHHQNGPKIICKEYFYGNDIQDVYERYDKSKDIALDGLIFTSINDPYSKTSKSPSLLKWKPVKDTTIDVLVENNIDNLSWDLYVTGTNSNVPFTFLTNTPIPENWKNQDYSGIVIECAFFPKFTPLKVRYDKDKPNYIDIALDNCKYIANPVYIEDLKKVSSVTCRKQSIFINLRNHHNAIKSYLVKKALVETSSEIKSEINSWSESTECLILDLACGRGGDLNKWSGSTINFDSASYTGIDINIDLLNEAKNRYNKANYKNLKCQFHLKDLSREIYVGSELCDIVSCQFAMHYFYKSIETWNIFMETVKRNIKQNGVFITCCFDGNKVFDYLGSNTSHSEFSIKPISWNTNLGIETVKSKIYGIPINVSLNGDAGVILNQDTCEYLIFADDFTRWMQQHGFYIIEQSLFPDTNTLKSFEKSLSKLHRYYVFCYLPEKIPPLLDNLWIPLQTASVYQLMQLPNTIELYYRLYSPVELLQMLSGNEKMISEPENYLLLAMFFNTKIGIINSNEINIYSPLVIVPNTRLVYFIQIESELYAIARLCNNVKMFTFNELEQEETKEEEEKEELLGTVETRHIENVANASDLLSSRPINGKGAWTINELKALSVRYNVSIKGKTKKSDIYEAILCNLE
jgi:ubiquinone/menaquinone biosynthesis C-methylase UbiE